MAHWSLFPGNHEIVEIEEDLNRGEQYRTNNYMKPELKREEKDRSLVANSRHISSLEDDLNQLFEVFSRRASSSGLVHPTQASSSKKSASKRPVIPGGSYSPKNGISERGNLKQALRGLCLSQASEMAAMKRSAKTSGSSKAGKIMTLYRNVVVEDGSSEHSLDDGKGGMLEISLVPEEKGFDSFQNSPENMTGSDSWPSNRSSLVERETKFTQVENGSFFESKISSNPEKPVSVMSLSSPHDNNRADVDHSPLNQRRMIVTSAEVGNRASLAEMRQEQKHTLLPSSSSSTAKNSTQEMALSSMKFSPATEFVSQASLTDSLLKENHESSSSSSSSHCKTSLEPARKMPAQKEMQHKEKAHSPCRSDPGDRNWEHGKRAMSDTRKLSASAEFASQTFSTDSITKDKHTPLHSSPPSNGKTSLELASRVLEKKEKSSLSVGARNQTKDEMLLKDEPAPSECNKSSPVGNRSPRKEPVGKSDKVEYESSIKAVKKDSSKILPSTGSPKVKKGSKSTRHTSHFVKPLVKTKNFVKRKSKKSMAVDNSSRNKQCEFNNDLYTSPSSLVCPRCQCVVTGAWQEASQESPVSLQESLLSGQESPIYHHESPVSYQESPVSPFGSLSAEVSSGNVISDVSTTGPSSESLNKTLTVVAEARGNSKTRDKGEFTQSSKGSPDECSTGTSISEESNLSRPSFCDRPHKSKDVRWEAIRHIRYQHGAIGLRHFNLLKKLGCGDIGTVYLAELIGTNCQFAIKVMDNEFLVRRKKISRAQTEREILRMLDHPFLPTLYCQFTSDNLSCLVMEYCPGGDLHVLRQRQPGRCFTEQAARFYAAEVLLALEYLHMLGVVYRDLKPENILVREDGHIMLSDFDLSLRCAVSPTLLVSSSMSERSKKVSRPCVDSRCAQPLCIEPSCQVTCFTPRLLASSSRLRKQKSDLAAEMRPLLQLVAEPTTARSNSFVGTHEYLAPEIIKGEGHGSAVDWWTLGIFLYELLYGRTPFKGSGNDETLANVVLQTLKFPDSPLVSLQARDLIATLLVKEPENRLGTERGAAEIKQHPFFDGLNWALIRCAVPPELPEQWSYGIPKVGSLDKNKYVDYNSGSGEHLEFEVF